MDECHYGTLVADGPAQQVPIDSDPLDSVTAVPAGTPRGHRLHRREDDVLEDHVLHDGGRHHEDQGYPDPLTWYSGGLATGTYEWECWMGPQCHHGTIVVE